MHIQIHTGRFKHFLLADVKFRALSLQTKGQIINYTHTMSFNLYVCQLIKVFKKGLQASCYKDRRNYWIFFFWIWIWGFLNIKDKRFKKYMYERARLWLCFCDLSLCGFRFVCVVASLCAVSVILVWKVEWP